MSNGNAAEGRLRVGSAPDSWGVWFPQDERQPPWQRFLDEVADAGYRWVELGPYGYLPTDPQRLRDELARRELTLSAGTCFTAFHRGDVWDEMWAHVREVAGLTAALGAGHLVVIPEMWRDQASGEQLEDRVLDDDSWRSLGAGIDRLAKAVHEEFGLGLRFHPHADSHVDTQPNVERFLEMTDPDLVKLCLDTGHISYCGGNNLELIEKYPSRIGYLHLKQVDPRVLAGVRDEDLPFGPAVRRGVMCEPPNGVPELEPIIQATGDLDADLFAIVEQDLYPCGPEVPLPIARRTRDFLTQCGAGTG
ncbi:sugar phosphate isomerase/epimerase [Saccharopolyspora sp. NFXS83]|uniref:sugar phosphate isomerase/epimerase family protein n=1 Tax=Saccharopolyspora sp. NFXS83 TaxID=2993560 RepID=UPI00224AF102|nr:sugar phosphate isomerase/epimerase [Saccharopolyspora sp. NFXS83]MCX2733065.1 sugar phosphate isomerase/epimerase [Saccharopolyspora sp. NFXS83]